MQILHALQPRQRISQSKSNRHIFVPAPNRSINYKILENKGSRSKTAYVISLLIYFQITKGDILSREADAKKSLEDHCCSPQFQRLIVLHCKLFRFSKATAGKTDEGK